MSQWKSPPPVVVLSGDEDFLRLREIREAVSVADEMGRSVEYVDGADREELSRILSSSGVFFQEEVLVVVENPEKVDHELVLRHHESESTEVVLVLHQKGAIKKKSGLGKVAAALPKHFVAVFEKPKPWEEAERAVKFCVVEARKRGVGLSEPLAGAIVKNVGLDLGILSFEIDKLARFTKIEGSRDVQVTHIKQTIGAFSELGPKPVVEALERFDVKGVSNALANMRRTHAGALGGATLRCCAFVSRSATKWLHIAALLEEGAGPDEISDRTGLHPFVLRKTLLPVAKRWGEGRLVTLLKSLALVERSVRRGHVNPWVQLECALLDSMTTEVGRAG
jgi:DNA polymerase III delta subunit